MNRMILRILAVLMLFTLSVTTAAATTYDELLEQSKNYTSGKIDKQKFIELCINEAKDENNDTRTRALAIALQGKVKVYTGDINQAKADAQAAIELDDSVPAGYQTMAEALLAEKKYLEAADYYEKTAERASKEEARQKILRFTEQLRVVGNAPSAAELHKEITDNPFAAEEKYADQSVAVHGKISEIGRTMRGMPKITMEAAKFKELWCEFPEDAGKKLAKLSIGDEILMTCNLKKAGNSIIELSDCNIWD